MPDLKDLFKRTWTCTVFASGYHNGASCAPDDPHTSAEWGCGWKWKALPLNDEQAAAYGLEVPVDKDTEAMAIVLWGYFGDSPVSEDWVDLSTKDRDIWRKDARRVLADYEETRKWVNG